MTRSQTTTSLTKSRSGSKMKVKLNPLTFQKMIKQAVKDLYGVTEWGQTRYFFQSPALQQLQQASEEYLENMWEQLKVITQLAGRRHVIPRDIREWKRISGFKVNQRSYQSLCSLLDLLPPKSKVNF